MTATSYPDPIRQDLSEEIGGRLVADPYRWLEEPSSDETTAWLAAQDALYADHLSALPGREALAGRIGELLAAGTVGVPAWRGSRQFFTRRMPGQEHSVLYADDWTRAAQLAVWGGSNGGLLVGAAITQRPDLYAAAICSAPLLDMVRYERFGLGETWNDEYGTAADPQELGWLLGYSPYHHVSDGTAYPAVLFTVFDSDSRVDPMHARKMCAALQHATSAPLADRPILLRRESDVGHGARAVSRSASLLSEALAFVSFHTGLSR